MATDTMKDEAKHLADAYLKEIGHRWSTKAKDFVTGRAILDNTPEIQIAVALYLTGKSYYADSLTLNILQRNLPFTAEQLVHLLEKGYANQYVYSTTYLRPVKRFVETGGELTDALRQELNRVRTAAAIQKHADATKVVIAVDEITGGEKAETLPDLSGEAWAQAVVDAVNTLPEAEASAWKQLFAFAQTADGSKPTKDWSKKAHAFSEAIGDSRVPTLARWLFLVSAPEVVTEHHVNSYNNGTVYEYDSHTGKYSDRNIGMLKGLAWASVGSTRPEMARALEKMAAACFAKIPDKGPWAVRAATAAIYALGESPENGEAVPALARIKTRITHRPTLAVIERTLEAVAKRQGVTKADLEDLSVPTYGIDTNGTRQETFGENDDYTLTLTVGGTGDVALSYTGPGGKVLKTVPAAVKSGENAERFKALKADADALGKTLTAQKSRFDGFYLAQRTWNYADFVTRFVEHPLLAQLTRRLIWHFAESDKKAEGLYDAGTGAFQDLDGQAIAWLSPTTIVSLWHPLGFTVETVQAWRERLAKLGIVQPFKQAHREVYLLTDAERATGTYSNRFAGHILKQHQMNTLAQGRGWQNQLRLMVDDSYPPASRDLPDWNIRAEYWIEGIGENYGGDTTDSGTYLYLSTDQVRFYPSGSAQNYAHAGGGGYSGGGYRRGTPPTPLSLTEVPALVFSEIMRDVDLFVGVASVGNDPSWQDNGAGDTTHRYGDYWQSYSFGELSASAQTRAAVLGTLLPRLKIASRTELSGRFLKVRGDLRTYKIHLGSGNILMEPNDQYLCIVQGRSMASDKNTGNVFLPFEGDARLSLILSKAFLLADDTKITDPTIISQINRK